MNTNWTAMEILITIATIGAITITWIQPIHPLTQFTLTCTLAGLWFIAKAQTEDNNNLLNLITKMNQEKNEGKK